MKKKEKSKISQLAKPQEKGESLLQVEDLSIDLKTTTGKISLTDRVSLSLMSGEKFGLVGESGSGKTITAHALMGFLPSPGGRLGNGSVFFQGRNIFDASPKELNDLRGNQIALICQEPGSSMNPILTIRRQLEEVFRNHPSHQEDPEKRIYSLLEEVGFSEPERVLNSYPYQLSGGMIQRVVIVMALLLKPSLLIADEPTTALDVTIQAQIMELLDKLCQEEGTTLILITHNLGLIAQYTQRLAVMYSGRIVETGKVSDFLSNTLHPYSRALLKSFPDLRYKKELYPIRGQVPSPSEYEDGCRFRQRCDYAMEKCSSMPILKTYGSQGSACFWNDLPLKEEKKKFPKGERVQ